MTATCCALAACVLIAILKTRGPRDPLVLIAFVYSYYTFGPVVNYLVGNAIYKGTVVDEIPRAALLFFLGTFSIAAVAMAVPPPSVQHRLVPVTRRWWSLIALQALLAVWSWSVGGYALLFLDGHAKQDRIAVIGSPVHYAYLLLQFAAMAFFFIARRDRLSRSMYWFNFAGYVSYCLMFSERDFVFVIAAIVIHKLAIRELSASVRLVGVGVALLFALTLVYNQRFGISTVSVADVLNQGSVLFVTSQVLAWTPGTIPYFFGGTYVNAFLNLVPSALYSTGFNLNEWLRDLYAPFSESYYGFGLEAEAYLNFGTWGVVPMFVILAVLQRRLSSRFGRSDLATYLSVFYTAFLMYAFRGDSFMLMKGTLYACVLYAGLRVSSGGAKQGSRARLLSAWKS